MNGDAFKAGIFLYLALFLAWASADETAADRSVVDLPIAQLRQEIDSGRLTSERLTQEFLARIEAIDRNGPRLQSIIATNPDALRQARELDKERQQGKSRGPLHGIPVLLKDNIESADPLPTTAGSLALINNVTGRDAPIVANLRAAGAVILGKTNLSEWANYRSDHSISGWSAVGGLTKNPHVLDRSACGSSAGSAVAVAAALASAAVGTETDGSITCPAAMNGVVAIKPTHGLLSGERIVPIAHSQDTAGPMARSVTGVAAMLTAMVGEKPMCLSAECKRINYVAVLDAATLAGKRIGVWRFAPGRWPQIDPVYERALAQLRAAGATLVEVAVPDSGGVNAGEGLVLKTEFKADLNAYLASTPAAVKVRSLADLIAFNRRDSRETVLFAQEIFERSSAAAGLDDEAYRDALADSRRLAGEEGITRVLRENRLDLVVAPTAGPAWRIDLVNGDQFPGSFSTLPAVSGYPHVTVPMGVLHQLPLGISFIGAPWSESQLLAAAYVFEQRSHARPIPSFIASIDTTDIRIEPQAVIRK